MSLVKFSGKNSSVFLVLPFDGHPIRKPTPSSGADLIGPVSSKLVNTGILKWACEIILQAITEILRVYIYIYMSYIQTNQVGLNTPCHCSHNITIPQAEGTFFSPCPSRGHHGGVASVLALGDWTTSWLLPCRCCMHRLNFAVWAERWRKKNVATTFIIRRSTGNQLTSWHEETANNKNQLRSCDKGLSSSASSSANWRPCRSNWKVPSGRQTRKSGRSVFKN